MLHIRSRRRSPALAAGVLLLAAPLSACGFNYATDQVYVASAGVNHREGQLDVLSAVVVSGQEGSGTFIASFSNNSVDSSERVVAITPGVDDPSLQVIGSQPISIPPTGFVNLAEDPSIAVTGNFEAGGYVSLKVDLEHGDDIEMRVPVVSDIDEYAGLDTSAETLAEASESAEPSDEASPTE